MVLSIVSSALTSGAFELGGVRADQAGFAVVESAGAFDISSGESSCSQNAITISTSTNSPLPSAIMFSDGLSNSSGSTQTDPMQSSPAGNSPNAKPKYNQLATEELTKLHMNFYLACVAELAGKYSNSVIADSYIRKNHSLYSELSKRCKDMGVFQQVLRNVASKNDTFEAGICIGLLNSEFTPEECSDRFKNGIRLGQFYNRIDGYPDPLILGLGAATLFTSIFPPGGFLLMLGKNTKMYGGYESMFQAVMVVTTASAAGAFVIGVKEMFSSAERDPDHFEKSRMHRYSRHPAAGLAAMAASGFVFIAVCAQAVSGNLFSFGTVTVLAPYLSLLVLGRKKILSKECALEKYDSKKYVEYKKRTNMLVPDLWKICSDVGRKFCLLFGLKK